MPRLRVGLEHLDPGVLTVERWDSPDKVEAQKLRFQPGDVIFGRRRAYQKKVARADFEGICSAHALVLRAKSGLMHPDFLPVFLASDYFLDRAIGISVGSLSPTVNWRDLKVQEFDLPPVPEQERLADLLWAVERHARSLATLHAQLAEAHVRTRHRAFDAAAARHGSHSVLEVTRIAAGVAFPHQYQGESEGDYPVIKVSDLGSEDSVMGAANWVTEAVAHQMRAKPWPAGTILFPKVGAALLTERRRLLAIEGCFDNNIMGLVPLPGVLPEP